MVIRRMLALALAIALAAGPAVPAAAAPAVTFNGKPVVFTAAPLSLNGWILAGTRDLAKTVGASVRWNDSTGQITLARNGNQVAYRTGSTAVWVNGTLKHFPVATQPHPSGQTMVPIGPLADFLGLKVVWAESSQTIRITDQAPASDFVFPFPQGASYRPYGNNFGETRTYNPDGSSSVRRHEGVDILAPKGQPLVAVGNGKIVRLGWSTLGGWRLTIALDKLPYRAYYAHLSGYAPSLATGESVARGQLLGWVGDTGYGPAGTSGKFPPHLHFGLYGTNGAINPYGYLKQWETVKAPAPK